MHKGILLPLPGIYQFLLYIMEHSKVLTRYCGIFFVSIQFLKGTLQKLKIKDYFHRKLNSVPWKQEGIQQRNSPAKIIIKWLYKKTISTFSMINTKVHLSVTFALIVFIWSSYCNSSLSISGILGFQPIEIKNKLTWITSI